jgi:quercetin dioxygenase-like cupin family protein
MADQTVVSRPGEGEALWVLGGLYEILVSSDETGNALTVIQFTIPEGAGPPPHVHDSAEMVRVLEGSARFHADGETFEAGPGTTLYFAAGVEETFEPIGQVKLMTTYAPGGMDRLFGEFGERAERREVPPPMEGPPDIERLIALGEKYGLQLRLPAPT